MSRSSMGPHGIRQLQGFLSVDTAPPLDAHGPPPLTPLELPVSSQQAGQGQAGSSAHALPASSLHRRSSYHSSSSSSSDKRGESSAGFAPPPLIGPKHGGSPVHTALRRGDSLAALKALEQEHITNSAGRMLHSYDGVGATPLHLAAASDDGALVGRLLALGADPLWPDFEGNSALHAAAAAGACRSIAALGLAYKAEHDALHLGIAITVKGDDDQAEHTPAARRGVSDMSTSSGCGRQCPSNRPNAAGWSPAMVAAANGRAAAIPTLLAAFPDADLHKTDRHGASALHLAARFNHAACGEALVLGGAAFVGAEDGGGDSPLHWAAAAGAGSALYALVARCGANVNCLNKARLTPLHLAVLHGKGSAAGALVALGANLKSVPVTGSALSHVTPLPPLPADPQDFNPPPPGGWNPVRHRAAKNTMHLFRTLQDSAISATPAGVAQTRRSRTAASRHSGASLTLLHQIASLPQMSAFVETLLQVGSGGGGLLPNARGCTPLHVAAERGNFNSASALLLAFPGAGRARDETGGAPLHWAARGGHFSTCALLVAGPDGCNITIRDSNGRTPLHWACASRAGGPIVGQLITELGAIVQCPDADGETPLHTAVRSGNSTAVAALMYHSGNPFQLNDMGDSPWGLASLKVSGQLIRVQRLTLRGLLMSLFLTVGLSYFDIVSDVLVAVELAQQEQPVFLLMVLGCIAATMCTAAVVAFRGRMPDGTPYQKTVLAVLASMQLLPLVEFVIDALALGTRVPLFQDRLRDHRFAEVVFESTPQALLQVFIVLGTLIDDPASPQQASQSVAPVQFLSIALSIISLTVFYALFLDTRAHGMNSALGVLCWGIRLVLVAARIGALVTLSLMTRDVYGIVPALVLDVVLATCVSSLWTGSAQWNAWKHTFGWAVPLPGTVLLPESKVYKVFLVRVSLDVALAFCSCVSSVATGAHSVLIQVAATCFVLTVVAHALSLLVLPRLLPKADVTFWTPPPDQDQEGVHSTTVVSGRSRRVKAKNALHAGTLHSKGIPDQPSQAGGDSANSSGNPLPKGGGSVGSEAPPSPGRSASNHSLLGAVHRNAAAEGPRGHFMAAVHIARNPMLRALEPFSRGVAAHHARRQQLLRHSTAARVDAMPGD